MDTPVEHEVYQVNGGGSILLKKQQFPDTGNYTTMASNQWPN